MTSERPSAQATGVFSFPRWAAVIALLVFLAAPAGSAYGAVKDSTFSFGKENDVIIDELEFKKATVQDAVRVISELTGINIIATEEAGRKTLTLFVRDLGVGDVVDSICRIAGLWYRHNPKNGIFIVMTTEEYQRDIVVFRYEPTRKFQLKFLNVGIVARTIYDLFGNRVRLLGKADRHLGDDWEIEDALENFEEDVDEADMEDDDNNNTRKITKIVRTSSSGQKGFKLPSLESGDLTPAQLALLEERMQSEIQAVTEGMVGQVSQRTEAPIYITVNRLHNMLFVRTSDEKAMEEIARIIEESDQQVPEVLLEMKVLEVQLTDQFESAFDISNISGSEKTGPDDGQAINPLNQTAESVGSELVGSGNFGLIENSTMVFQVLSSNLRMRLQLLETENNIKSLATPMLLAANNHPAKLFIGEETIITTGFSTQEVETTSSSSTVIKNYYPVPDTEVREIGNTLTILPSINADRSVVMRIIHETSSVEENGASIPLLVGSEVQNVYVDTVNTSTLKGTVLAQDGMTVAVGGMMRTTKVDTENKVPVLGDIPLLGFFFKEQLEQEQKTELVLLITPHVIRAPVDGEEITRDRMNDLTDHPNAIDIYLEERQAKRADKEYRDRVSISVIGDGAADDQKQPAETADRQTESRVVSGLEQSFIELIRVAATQVRIPYLFRQPEGAVTPVNLGALGQVPIFNNPQVVARPVASWSNRYHYVTALKVENRGKERQLLDVGSMNGSWLAATLESQELGAKGVENDYTYLYLISPVNFERMLPMEVRQ